MISIKRKVGNVKATKSLSNLLFIKINLVIPSRQLLFNESDAGRIILL